MKETDFPLLDEWIYLDNACTTLKPPQVIDAIRDYYVEYPVCSSGRSSHILATQLKILIDEARNAVGRFINAKDPKNEIVFTKNCTESLNILANSFKGKKTLISNKEHNSNHLVWRNVQIGELWKDGQFDTSELENILKNNPDIEMVSLLDTSNLDGTSVPDLRRVSDLIHDHDAMFVLDAAQTVPHRKFNVIDIDAVCFSLHKMLGPTGVGVLYAKNDIMEKIDPLCYGGGTVDNEIKLLNGPQRFEAGIQNYAGICGVTPAIRYLEDIGMDKIEKHELKLQKKVTNELKDVVEIIGPEDPNKRSGIFSFNIPGQNCHDVSITLERNYMLLTRSGYHCVHNWFKENNIAGSVRASMYFYNTFEDLEILINGVYDIIESGITVEHTIDGPCF